MHNIDENEVLRDVLSGLNEDVPPMPEGLHSTWMEKVEEDQMEYKRTEKTRNRKAFTRFLSVAAAMVFVIGGTLLTRDDLEDRALLEKEYAALVAANDELANTTATAAEYKQRLADYEAAESEYGYVLGARQADSGTVNASLTMARSTSDALVTPGAAPTLAKATSSDVSADDAVLAEEAVEKKIIRTASLTIQTQTYDGSLASLKAMCEAEGGWIESSSESLNSSTGLRRAYLTLRIPQDALDGYLAGTEELGRVTSRSETATDVTASYQDTQARLETQLALMERLQALITESADLSDLLALESQIADTQYMIDSLQSSLNTTDRQVTYSTVDINLREENAPALTDATVSLGDRVAAALRLGLETLTDFAQDVLVFLIAALPFIAIVAAFALILSVIRKIKRRNK